MTEHEGIGDRPTEGRGTLGIGLTFLFIGAGLGALMGFLYAPQTGKKTRRLVKRKYEDARDQISERAFVMKERAQDWKERARDWRDQAQDIAEDTASDFRKMRRKLK